MATVAEETRLDLPVEFGGVSIGQETARLGLKVSRDSIELPQADNAFCGRRLTGKIVLGSDDPDQTVMFDGTHKVVDATFDVKKYGVSSEWISTGLTFALNDVDIETLAKFSKGKGRVRIENIAVIPLDAIDEDDDEHQLLPGALKAEGPWRDVSLDTVFEGALLKNLKKEGIATVGDLQDYTATGDKRLTDIPGVGQSKSEFIEERMLQFWAHNPQYSEGE